MNEPIRKSPRTRAIHAAALRRPALLAAALLALGAAASVALPGGRADAQIAVAGGAPGTAANAPQVPVATVGRDRFAQSESWDGTLQAVRQATIGAQAQGRIVKLHVQAGDGVKAGQVLAEIDAREANLAVSRDRAQLGESQATLAEARAAYERSRELHEKGFISKAALEQAAAALKVAEARQSQAQAGIGLSSVASEHTIVRAPWDGVVTAVPVQVGDLATPGRPLFELHAPDKLRAVAFLPNSRVAEAAGAPRAWVRLDAAGRTTQLESTQIVAIPSADPASGTTEVRVELPGGAGAGPDWVPGRHVRVAFDTAGAQQALVVPAASLLVRGELVGVYVATDSGFVLRAVRVGQRSGDSVEILSGLREGERIALDPVRAGLKGAMPAAR
ncbi:efflux RND transporter periplasmic adaptor subunit [Burkholderiaceae bacterium FT117]|uniref:efflux RND transporter periplasmic adaptor subunit n=1 Tax=Zeimonas sediminis TaxID=2944268 RepID=UPI002342BE51|nr:efflux RND transporter periplasmic adaptor subunit [Zeimonas sediminis]MCM5568975.1 efflux RND transporter periplasmic adaptor subunit [Zeimonas sediminis]